MPTTSRSAELETAIRAVRAAALATTNVRMAMAQQGAMAVSKEDKSPVTVADFAAQAVVAFALAEAYGGDPLVGEEDAEALRADAALCTRVVEHVGKALGRAVAKDDVLRWLDRGGADGSTRRHWVLDPVDGTKGFLRGGQYAIALALVEDGEVVVAALGCPAYAHGAGEGLVLAASRGEGAFELATAASHDRRRLAVASARPFARVRLCESVESGHTDQQVSARIAAELGLAAEPVRMDSQAKYAAVARGDADLYLRLPTRADYREKVWDHAAGVLVLHEAGGRATDVDGKELDFGLGRTLRDNRGVIASTGHAHDRVVEVVRSALAR